MHRRTIRAPHARRALTRPVAGSVAAIVAAMVAVALASVSVPASAASALPQAPQQALSQAPAQESDAQATVVFEMTGGKLIRHDDDTYQLTADGAPLREVATALVQLAGVEISVAEEIAALPVAIETDAVALGTLLGQLRAALGANMITASSSAGAVSRVWLTATDAQRVPVAAIPVGAPQMTAAGALPGAQPGQGPPMPLPTGTETHAVGELGMDVQTYIEQQRQAALAANANGTAGAPTGAGATPPGATPGRPPGQRAGEPQPDSEDPADQPATTPPPIPMDPNALEKFFAGDSRTQQYHRLNCIQAMYISPDAKMWFQSREEAIAAGYTPHEICINR